MRILVTGGSGKIGRLAVAELAEHEIINYDITNGDDILDTDKLYSKMSSVDVAVHLAAIPHPNARPFRDFFDVNVLGTLNVAEAAYNAGVKRMVYSSSTAYYGCDIDGMLFPDYLPIDEKHPNMAQGRSRGGIKHYPFSKVMAEQILAYYGTNKMMQTVALRLAPANYKRQQYPGDFDWRSVPHSDYRRGCFWANCNPEYCAQAIRLAVESEREFWYEPFNIIDKYVPNGVNVYEFRAQEYHGVPLRVVSDADSLISPQKAIDMLGFEPCEER